MLSAHPAVPLSSITLTHSSSASSSSDLVQSDSQDLGEPSRGPARLTLHTATGRQLHVEEHGLPSPHVLSPLATPTGSGAATPERRGSDDDREAGHHAVRFPPQAHGVHGHAPVSEHVSRASTRERFGGAGDAFAGMDSQRERVSGALLGKQRRAVTDASLCPPPCAGLLRHRHSPGPLLDPLLDRLQRPRRGARSSPSLGL